MERPPRFRILDESGQPQSPHVEEALVSLVPKFQRHFPAFRDDSTLTDILEEAGQKIAHREEQSGRIEKLHAYAWVTLRNVATSRLRRARSRLERRTFGSEEGEAALDAMPANRGTADQIERDVLLREVLETLTLDERLVCIWKKAGFTSREIADRRGGTAAAVDTLLSRVKQKVRRLLGVRKLGDAPRDEPAGEPSGNSSDPSQRGADVENRDDE